MAIDTQSFHFLDANKGIFQGKNVLMMGRQHNYIQESVLKKAQIDITNPEYTEDIWKHWGVKKIQSMDVSDYENAEYIHDHNIPLTDTDLLGEFDIVFDGGTTEHIYHCTTAIENYKKLLTKGGYYIAILPSNNWCNHGFYQFSPEFFYRTFSEDRGYKTKCFLKNGKQWYYAQDLINLGERFHASIPTSNESNLIFVIAQKMDEIQNQDIPMQTVFNDYLWKSSESIAPKTPQISKIRKIYRFFRKHISMNLIDRYFIHKKVLTPVVLPIF